MKTDIVFVIGDGFFNLPPPRLCVTCRAMSMAVKTHSDYSGRRMRIRVGNNRI